MAYCSRFEAAKLLPFYCFLAKKGATCYYNKFLGRPNGGLNSYSTIYLDKGGENEVFYDGASTIYKLNNFEYAGDNLENFFIRFSAHNKFFSNVPYQMIGFAHNSQHEFCAVLIQPHIKAEREATEDEITKYMEALGFEMDYIDELHNEQYEVFDAVPSNVLYGIDNDLYFIDTQLRVKRE